MSDVKSSKAKAKVSDEIEEVVSADEGASDAPKPKTRLSPVEAEKARQKAVKERQKAEAEARRADMKKFAAAAKEADKAAKAADAAQRKADKAREKADKLQEVADAANQTALDEPSEAHDQADEKAANAATAANEDAGRLQKEANAAQKKATKLRGGRKMSDQKKVDTPGSRQWVPPTFITVGLLGVLWLVVFYITASVGIEIPYMTSLGGWNIMIGMGLMASAFGIATLWK